MKYIYNGALYMPVTDTVVRIFKPIMSNTTVALTQQCMEVTRKKLIYRT
jgi:hypothetical protein